MMLAATKRGPRTGSRRGWAALIAGIAGAILTVAIAPLVFAQGQPPLPSVRLSAGLYAIEAEVARTPSQLQQGLMFRTELGARQGMLFIFEQSRQQCMWMQNTLIPLSVAFLANDGTIVNIEHMTPQTRTSHCSAQPVRLALEMNQGWFERHNIQPGSRIRGLPELP